MSKFNFNLQEKGSKNAFSILLIVLFIIFSVLSIVFLSKKDNYIKIKADIKNINCNEVRTKHTSNRGVVTYSYKYNCNINVTYNIKDKNLLEYLLFYFSILGFLLDILYTYIFFSNFKS
jgi:tellurite resistance protein TehA-like permease